jgi:hypothetical protein
MTKPDDHTHGAATCHISITGSAKSPTTTASWSRCSATASWPAPRDALHSYARGWAVLHSEGRRTDNQFRTTGPQAMRDTLFMGFADVVARLHRDSYGGGSKHHGRRHEVPDPQGSRMPSHHRGRPTQPAVRGCRRLAVPRCRRPTGRASFLPCGDFGSRHPGSSYSHRVDGPSEATRGSTRALGRCLPAVNSPASDAGRAAALPTRRPS